MISTTLFRAFKLTIAVIAVLLQAACSLFYTDDRPEVQYQRAYSAEHLQIPPDLSSPDQTAGFIVSGVDDGKIQRNTLLPALDEVRFVRDGKLGWLELSASTETLWPLVRQFIQREGLLLQREEPLSGYMQTTWAEDTIEVQKSGFIALIDSALQLVRPTSELSSYRFRFEREGENRTRLFVSYRRLEEARLNSLDKDEAGEFGWVEAEADPEVEAQILTRLMVYLGIDVQRARGILSDDDIALLDSPAYVTTNEGGETALFVGRTMALVWLDVGVALENLNFKVEDDNIDAGRYQVTGTAEYAKNNAKEDDGGFFSGIADFFSSDDNLRNYLVYVGDTTGGTHITISDDNGDALDPKEEIAILNALRQYFI